MIRIGIVGCGRILAAHLRGYRLLREAGIDDFRITALCARRKEDASSYVQRGNGPPQRAAVSTIPGDPLAVSGEYLSDFQDDVEVAVYDDFSQLIAEGPIDAVNDYTLYQLHHQIALLSAERGLHLLAQKPLAATVADAREMCDVYERRNLTLGVFENWRFKPDAIRMLSLLQKGLLGTPQILHAGAIGAWWAPDQIVAHTPWRHRRESAGGITLDMGVHQFDFVRAVGGEVLSIDGRVTTVEPVRRTFGGNGVLVAEVECDADDTYFASFDTENGVLGSVHASWSGGGAATVCGPGPTVYTSTARICGERVDLRDGTQTTLQEFYTQHTTKQEQERDFPRGLNDSFALTQCDWLAAIRESRPPITDGREGLRDLACAWAVLESSRAGRRVSLDEILNGRLSTVQNELAFYGSV